MWQSKERGSSMTVVQFVHLPGGGGEARSLYATTPQPPPPLDFER